jgi:BON domain
MQLNMSQFQTGQTPACLMLQTRNERKVRLLIKPSGCLRSSLLLLVLLFTTTGVCACAQNATLPPTTKPDGDGAQARALEAVAHQGSPAIEANGVIFSRTEGGAVRSEPTRSRAGIVADDVALEAELRGRMASDPTMTARDVDIDVDKGVVRLCGSVPDSTHAARLVDMALELPGVRAVESSLAWVSRSDAAPLDRSPVAPRTTPAPRAAR